MMQCWKQWICWSMTGRSKSSWRGAPIWFFCWQMECQTLVSRQGTFRIYYESGCLTDIFYMYHLIFLNIVSVPRKGVQAPIYPAKCAWCYWWEHVSVLSWVRQRCGLLLPGCDEQTKQRSSTQNLWRFGCSTSTSGGWSKLGTSWYLVNNHITLFVVASQAVNSFISGFLWRSGQPTAFRCELSLSWHYSGHANHQSLWPVV